MKDFIEDLIGLLCMVLIFVGFLYLPLLFTP